MDRVATGMTRRAAKNDDTLSLILPGLVGKPTGMSVSFCSSLITLLVVSPSFQLNEPVVENTELWPPAALPRTSGRGSPLRRAPSLAHSQPILTRPPAATISTPSLPPNLPPLDMQYV